MEREQGSDEKVLAQVVWKWGAARKKVVGMEAAGEEVRRTAGEMPALL
ncbi:MAG: hypothetical protein WBS24_00560 [Terriglobales bacterium]